MKNIRIFLGQHKALNFIVCILAVWILIICYDMFRVDVNHDTPACAFETDKGSGHYVGAGYTFDIVENPVTGEAEYSFCLFGKEMKTTITN